MPGMDRQELNTVYLINEKVYGELVEGLGTYFSMVKFTDKGIDYEILMENEDFILLADLYDADAWEDPE